MSKFTPSVPLEVTRSYFQEGFRAAPGWECRCGRGNWPWQSACGRCGAERPKEEACRATAS